MHSEDRITVQAPTQRIYDLAATIERWPDILPHYRRVTILRDDGQRRLAEMAATRDGFPVKWTSIQELDPERHRIRFHHVRGITRGMDVEWIIEPGASYADVRIVHDFDPPWPAVVGPLVATYVVGNFIHNIAGKTLHRIKKVAEEESNHRDMTT